MTKPQIKGDALRQQDSQIPPMIDNKSAMLWNWGYNLSNEAV